MGYSFPDSVYECLKTTFSGSTNYIFPSKGPQRNIRRRIKYFTKRRAQLLLRS
jgi:hypothetical protein